MVIWIVVALLLCILIYRKGMRKPKNFPPGPPRLPLLGSIPFMKGNSSNDKIWNKDLADKYGPIVGMYLGNQPFVMITDPKLAARALSHDALIGRPFDPLAIAVRGDGERVYGILMSDGPSWYHQMSFTNRTLKDLQLGKSGLQDTIKFEAEEMAENMAKRMGQDVLLDDQFGVAIMNVLWSTLAYVRYEHDNVVINDFVAIIRSFFRTSSFLRLFFGVLKYFPELSGLNKRKRANAKLRSIILPVIEEQKRQVADGVIPDNFIGRYLAEMKRNPNLNERELICILQDIFGAGFETVSSTMLFIIEYLVVYPEVQQKCYEEIVQLEEENIEANIMNQNRFHYVNATIHEVFRVSCLTASVIPHRALTDTVVDGYTIPKDTTILTNMMINNKDPQYYRHPETFDPTRFLDDKCRFRRSNILTPFGVGKRTCPGENLARGEIFIFLCTLLKRFRFEQPVEHQKPTLEVIWGLARLPAPFWVRMTARSGQ